MVLPLEDWLDGEGPECLVNKKSSSACPAASIRRGGAAAQAAGLRVVGLFMKNWGTTMMMSTARRQDLVDVDVGGRRAGHRPGVSELRRSTRTGCSPVSCANTRAGARRTRHPVQLGDQVQGLPRPRAGAGRRPASPPATTPRCANGPTTGGTNSSSLKAEDGTKDQSYFLYRLNQAQLSKTLFPLGGLYKREVRKMAEGGRAARRSTRRTRPASASSASGRSVSSCPATCRAKPGEIRTLEGDRVIGQHQGLMHHTIGQRKGLLIGGLKGQPG